MKRMLKVFTVLLVVLAVGCATVSYERPDGTKLKYMTFARRIKASVKLSADQTEADINAGVDPVATDYIEKAIELGMRLASTTSTAP